MCTTLLYGLKSMHQISPPCRMDWVWGGGGKGGGGGLLLFLFLLFFFGLLFI